MRYGISAAVCAVLAALFLYGFFWRAPAEFPEQMFFSITPGATLSQTSARLAKQRIIRSPFWFKTLSALWGGTRGLKAGDYFFSEPLSVFSLSWRLTHSAYELEPVTITIPEGFNNREIAARLAEKLVRFDAEQFLRNAKEKEGYLFPDTYRFLPNESSDRIIGIMEENFKRRMKTVEREVSAFGRPFAEVLVMASLIEEEARTSETRRRVAEILWKRLDARMSTLR